jgi:hypothetical protein
MDKRGSIKKENLKPITGSQLGDEFQARLYVSSMELREDYI